MTDLATTFMGIELRNPILVGACHLTGTLRKIRACERAGAGAVVLKSIFERQVQAEASGLVAKMKSPSASNANAVLKEVGTNLVLDDYLKLVEDAKKSLKIPVVASLHCVSHRAWEEYAERIEGVGADALQLNLFELGSRAERGGREIEREYLEVARRVRRRVKVPLAAKLSPNLSSLAAMAEDLRDTGINALVLFNRYYGPDIDVEKIRLVAAPVLSGESEALPALRWIGILSGRMDLDFAATGGIHTSGGVLKQLLAGARVVELCTALYTGGLEHIGAITTDISAWMGRHKFATISDFRGSLSQDESASRLFESTQYSELERASR